MVKDILLVEPDPDIDTQIQDILGDIAIVTAVADFPTARQLLFATPPDLLITNLRLDAYNGIHLALLADRSRTKCIVYADVHDMVLAREVQEAGAFYERLNRLPFVLQSYLRGPLPSRDLRNLLVDDRRGTFRGGRQSMDLLVLSVDGSKPDPGQRPH